MLSRRKHFTAVVSAEPGRLGPRRIDGEIWNCVLACGHSEWRIRKDRIEDRVRPAPKKLLCGVCADPMRAPELRVIAGGLS